METANEIKKTSVFCSDSVDHFDSTEIIKVNRKFKDSIFKYIFTDPNEFVELYYSLSGTKLDVSEVETANLDSFVIFDWQNDVSFITKDRHIIILLEQQSTICANMSIRCLVYYSNLIRKLYEEKGSVFKKEIYTNVPIMIPKPEFYILYNGKDVLKYQNENLVSHFYDYQSDSINLNVKYIDIHYNSIKDKKSETLKGYSFFIEEYLRFEKEAKLIESDSEKIKIIVLKMLHNPVLTKDIF